MTICMRPKSFKRPFEALLHKAISTICNNLCQSLQGRVTANGRVGATAAVYTAAILGASSACPVHEALLQLSVLLSFFGLLSVVNSLL